MPHDRTSSRLAALYQKVPGSSDGDFTGTAEVEIVPPVPEHVARRRARVTIVNEDDQTITPTVSRYDPMKLEIDAGYRLVMPEASVLTGETLQRDDITLTPGQSIVGKLNVGTSDKPVTFEVEWEDEVAVTI